MSDSVSWIFGIKLKLIRLLFVTKASWLLKWPVKIVVYFIEPMFPIPLCSLTLSLRLKFSVRTCLWTSTISSRVPCWRTKTSWKAWRSSCLHQRKRPSLQRRCSLLSPQVGSWLNALNHFTSAVLFSVCSLSLNVESAFFSFFFLSAYTVVFWAFEFCAGLISAWFALHPAWQCFFPFQDFNQNSVL